MSNAHHNNEAEHFPCDCHRPEYAYTDSLCPLCEEEREREQEARRNGEHAEPDDRTEADWEADKREMAEELARDPWEGHRREADNQAFADAAGQMTREDWDADNDWLASAGWGEM
jgi:hypothetical protein